MKQRRLLMHKLAMLWQNRPIVKMALLLTMVMAVALGCAPEAVPEVASSYNGGIFKGPYAVSARVTIYQLDSELKQTGASYTGDIISDDGTYNIESVPITGYVELIADGYFYNEITGVMTTQPLTMSAITENTGTVNITLFTALTTDRIRALFESGLSMELAKAQAMTELFDTFGFIAYQSNPEDVNVQTANGAALCALSAAFAQDRTAAEIQELITILRTDLADGEISDISMLQDTGKKINPTEVKANLQGYYELKGIDIVVPDFSDELMGFMPIVDDDGEPVIVPDAISRIQLVDGETVTFGQGVGYLDGFLIPDGVTMTWTAIGVTNDVFRMYNTDNVIASADFLSAVAVGPCYAQFDYGCLWGEAQTFQLEIKINDVVQYANMVLTD